MRKLLLFLCAVSLGYASEAQTTKGTVALTGSLGYTQFQAKSTHTFDAVPFPGYEPNKDKQSSYTVSPSVGYFVKDNLELGASVYASRNTYESVNHYGSYNDGIVTLEGQHNSTRQSNYKGFNLYARQYKFLTEKLALHATLSAGQSTAKVNSTFSNTVASFYQSSENEDRQSILAAALSPGVTFFASRKIGLNANVGALWYNRYKREYTSTYTDTNQPQPSVQIDPSTASNSLALSFSSMHLNFGISYFLGK